jgi:long-chain acyl-CoA synthetase
LGLLGRNSSGWATAYLAVLSHGAVAVPILPDFRDEDVHHILDHSDAALLLPEELKKTPTRKIKRFLYQGRAG